MLLPGWCDRSMLSTPLLTNHLPPSQPPLPRKLHVITVTPFISLRNRTAWLDSTRGASRTALCRYTCPPVADGVVSGALLTGRCSQTVTGHPGTGGVAGPPGDDRAGCRPMCGEDGVADGADGAVQATWQQSDTICSTNRPARGRNHLILVSFVQPVWGWATYRGVV